MKEYLVCSRCGRPVRNHGVGNMSCPVHGTLDFSQVKSIAGGEETELRSETLAMPRARGADDTPEPGTTVLAVLQHWHTKNKRFAVLKSVDEDDCSYRTADDNSELSHDWNVIAWDRLPELK